MGLGRLCYCCFFSKNHDLSGDSDSECSVGHSPSRQKPQRRTKSIELSQVCQGERSPLLFHDEEITGCEEAVLSVMHRKGADANLSVLDGNRGLSQKEFKLEYGKRSQGERIVMNFLVLEKVLELKNIEKRNSFILSWYRTVYREDVLLNFPATDSVSMYFKNYLLFIKKEVEKIRLEFVSPGITDRSAEENVAIIRWVFKNRITNQIKPESLSRMSWTEQDALTFLSKKAATDARGTEADLRYQAAPAFLGAQSVESF